MVKISQNKDKRSTCLSCGSGLNLRNFDIRRGLGSGVQFTICRDCLIKIKKTIQELEE